MVVEEEIHRIASIAQLEGPQSASTIDSYRIDSSGGVTIKFTSKEAGIAVIQALRKEGVYRSTTVSRR